MARAGQAARGLRLAILGTRGVPARYGGFETFAEQLSRRLAARGHRVTVYGRRAYAGDGVPGVVSVPLPALPLKHLETLSATLLAALHASRRPFDVALVCNSVNAVFLPLLRAAGIPTAVNVDGLEWQRRKWGLAARQVHRLSEHLVASWADAVVADAGFIAAYWRDTHGIAAAPIAYGGDLTPPSATGMLDHLGLEPGGYDLCVCRFEPENRPLTVVRAHRRLSRPRPLVMVGDAPYARRYVAEVRAAAGPDVHFTGFLFGEAYRQLLFHARALVYAGEVGGTHPVLLEAMGAGRLVIYHDTPENRETVADAGLPFGPGGEEHLAVVWGKADRPGLGERLGERARRRVAERYRWQAVTDAYEALLRRLAGPATGRCR